MGVIPFSQDEEFATARVPFPTLTGAQVETIAELMDVRSPRAKMEIHQVKASHWTHTYLQIGKDQWIVTQRGVATQLNVTIERKS
jgi:hypothetical protein